MKEIEKIAQLNKKFKDRFKQSRLSSYLAMLTSAIIIVIVLSTTSYVITHIKNISKEYSTNFNSFNFSLSPLVARSFTESYNEGDLDSISKIATNLKERSMLAYAYAVNKRTQRVFWSTEENLIGKTKQEAQKVITEHYTNSDVMENLHKAQNFSLCIGLLANKTGTKHLNILLDNMKIFVAIFLFLGFLASAVMSRIILKPLDEIAIGARELTNGNFDFRLKESNFKEINELVDSYNYMASQLQELYESLELKVQERTIALERANQEIKESQSMLVHSEKMRSLGELVAGIAHEINNPVNFIHGNIMILEKYMQDIFSLIDLYSRNETTIPEEELKKVKKLKADIDIEFLKDDIKDLIRSCIEGTERTKNIVLDLKNFSRMEEMVLTQFNIPKEIDTTLNILNNKYKNRITVHKDYEENLPKIEAYGGQLNQVFMNILDNAQYAIKGDGDVYITVKKEDSNIVVIFKDSGHGIAKKDLIKVFDPFFTTKPPGEGTGLGMSITYRVIKNHNGEISVDSEEGVGTTFTIKLPINNSPEIKEEDNEKIV